MAIKKLKGPETEENMASRLEAEIDSTAGKKNRALAPLFVLTFDKTQPSRRVKG